MLKPYYHDQKTLKESDATFKFIINANPILDPDFKNKKDNYANSIFQYGGDEIREYLNQFDNVYLCNGDRHWQYVTHFEGTSLWEFSCGAGSDMHAGESKQGDVDGNVVHEETFKKQIIKLDA